MDCSSECHSPPAYSVGDSSPAYSVIPRATERTLQQSRRHSRTPPNGVTLKCVGNVTLLLTGQEDNVEWPTVRGGTQLSGSVLLQNTANIKSVVLTIEGHLETNPLTGSYSYTNVVRITKTLYQGPPPSCPHNFNFTHNFPSTFRHSDGNAYFLPPTCYIPFESPLRFIKCTYRITVAVESVRHRYTSFLTKNDSVSFELDHRPRTRPSQPLIQNPSLFDTVKRCPEEWTQCGPQIISIATNLHVLCDLFAPSVGVFCVSEPIPFHLQLSSPEASLRRMHEFFQGPSTGSHVRVYILRQIAVDVGDRIVKRNIILGEGRLRLLSTSEKGVALNWEGEARCRDPASVVGSFDCGPAVVVTDMLAVQILPPKGCPLKGASFGYAIKLTTNSWDGEDRGRSDWP
ncbi:hypothetical protein FB451DRAFT_132583 [Mycena latifolia]|nr:hypothetical protein FB451DRAFT_132583 [Mycena latifolia]